MSDTPPASWRPPPPPRQEKPEVSWSPPPLQKILPLAPFHLGEDGPWISKLLGGNNISKPALVGISALISLLLLSLALLVWHHEKTTEEHVQRLEQEKVEGERHQAEVTTTLLREKEEALRTVHEQNAQVLKDAEARAAQEKVDQSQRDQADKLKTVQLAQKEEQERLSNSRPTTSTPEAAGGSTPIQAIAAVSVTSVHADDSQFGKVFINSLGQRYVSIPGISGYFCIWDTRVSDYKKFIAETKRSWKAAGFPQQQDHPAVRINYYDATSFCQWLTQKEHTSGILPSDYEYRLPNDLEWSAAAGIGKEIDGLPAWRSGGIPNCYAWGTNWPPPSGSGNYDPKLKCDPFPYTSPVGSFAANQYGLYDMNGNVYQWILENYDDSSEGCLRGASWPDEEAEQINLSYRDNEERGSAYKCFGFRCVIARIGTGVAQSSTEPPSTQSISTQQPQPMTGVSATPPPLSPSQAVRSQGKIYGPKDKLPKNVSGILVAGDFMPMCREAQGLEVVPAADYLNPFARQFIITNIRTGLIGDQTETVQNPELMHITADKPLIIISRGILPGSYMVNSQ